MKKMLGVCVLVLLVGVLAPNALASLIGTVITPPGATVAPGLVPPGTSPGTLLADEVEPWSFTTTAGTTSGTFTTAVYLEAGGTLDFYYQVANNANSATSIARESNVNFFGFVTATGFRIDGSILVGSPFVDGTVAPVTADRDAGATTVGFNFNPPDASKILPGTTSNVLVISTNATNFTRGNSELLDGGSVTLDAFQPVAPVPEPASLALLGSGLVGAFGAIRRKMRK